jgi:hypothetical protein
MNSDEFENLIEGFIEHRSGEDDRLPAQTFFELLAERQASQPPLEIHISWLETGPVITAPPDAPLVVEGRHIRFDDGRELILNFDLNSPEKVPA